NECTCPSGDGSLRHPCPAHPAPVEQAGGDEREEFEALIYACKNLAQITSSDGSGHADIAMAVLRMAGVGDDERERLVNEWKAARAWKPSPGQAEKAEAERPEVVGVRYEDGTILSAEDCGTALEVCAKVQTPLMTVAQHERIVGALRAVIAQLRQHKNDYMDSGQETYRALQNEIREREAEIARLDGLVSGRTAERDAALARVAELDKQCRDDVARALGLRPSQERGFAWSYLLASIKSCVKASEDAAQAQHSVPIAPEFKRALGLVVAALEADGDRPTSKYALSEMKKVLAAAPGNKGV
ncbi:hypothetical protein ODJ71_28760, partial [Pseudomonas aeruginosa]|nr:hypothetical protein [Pseudomonas aeruginosa]